MRLYIRQKVFSWTDSFKVLDENGKERYHVKGEFFSLGKRLYICDACGREVARIQQKLFSFLPTYFVYMGGREIMQVTREFSFFTPRYSIELSDGTQWAVEGRFWEHDYEILQGGCMVASIHKEWMTWGDCYEIDIVRGEDELDVMAAALIIDCVTAPSNNN